MLPCIENMLDKTWYQAASLGAAAGLATTLILVLNELTSPAIAMRVAEDQRIALEKVMPTHYYQNDIVSSQQRLQLGTKIYQLYTALDDSGKVTGYVVQTEGKGYSGDIKLLVDVDTHLTILGVRVVSHTETPGLGDKIEINKADWITHFNGHSLSNTEAHQWAVKKDGGLFDQFSGATITPRAVVTAVHQALLDIEAATANGSMTTLPTKENTQ